jgi:hypothetical protein
MANVNLDSIRDLWFPQQQRNLVSDCLYIYMHIHITPSYENIKLFIEVDVVSANQNFVPNSHINSQMCHLELISQNCAHAMFLLQFVEN